MLAYSFLVYTCMALAMTATAIAMKRDMAIDFGNVTHPPGIPLHDKRNTTTENFHTKAVTTAGKDILELDNETVSGPPIDQTTKMTVTENDADANALLQEMKQLKKKMEQIKALVHAVKAKVAEEKMAEAMVAEEKTTKDKVEKKKTTRNIRAKKYWSFDYPYIHELDAKTDATPSTFEPIKPYKGFSKFGHRLHILSDIFGRLKRNHHSRSLNYHPTTETYVASKDKSGTSANANEYDGNMMPKIYTSPIPPTAMESEALDNYNNDNARLPASTQDAPRHVDEMMRDQRKDNEDHYKLSFDMETNDMPTGSSFSNHFQELNADEQKLNDMLEASTKNTLDAKTDATPSILEPIMPYNGFGKVGYGRTPHLMSYMLGRRKRNHRGRFQKYHDSADTYAASKDKSGTSANANEYDGKILPHIYAAPDLKMKDIPPMAMDSEALDNYNNDNTSPPASTQDDPRNVDEMMRDQRKDNEDPFKQFFDMEANDMPSGSSFSNHVQELNADEQKLNDMLEASTKNTVFSNVYEHPRHLPKNHFARKLPQRKHTQIHGFVPGSFSVTINNMPKDKEPLSSENAMLPVTYKLRNEPQKERTTDMKDDTVAMKDRSGAFKTNEVAANFIFAKFWKYVDSMLHYIGLGDVHETAKNGLEKGINPDGESQLDGINMGLESGEINQKNFAVSNDKRDSAALEGPGTKTEVKSFTFPLKKLPRFFTDPDMEPSKIGPMLLDKSLQTIIKLEPGENEEQDMEVVCPIHGGGKGNAKYGQGIFCSCHLLTKRKYLPKPEELKQK